MINAEESTGLMVMVSPVLWTSDYAGRLGLIAFADYSRDEIWVDFEDEEELCFSAKTLFILRPTDELKLLAENRNGALWHPVPQNLQAIAWLQNTGSAKQLKKAFELLQDDPELHRWATVRLNEAVDLDPARKIGR
ncbi:MAG: hypothetical protein JST19_16410 [Bacteroidetes bacterium]|nr:hypothetical protein [Bacteroidota bacterium]